MSEKGLPIITGKDNSVLRKKSDKVSVLTKDLKKLLEKMHLTVREADGIGLAAPQVGYNVRMIVAQISGTFLSMINPEIISFSSEQETMEEGCLSLPGIWGMVPRPREITMKFLDERGQEHRFFLSGLNARVVQHEIDHLDGILFLDRIPDGSSYRKKKPLDEKGLSA